MPKTKWNISGEELTDEQLVDSILKGDSKVSKEFFYRTCYPLFAATYNKYYTDCESVVEFINEIYLYILYEKKDERTPFRKNSKLGKFSFRCTLTMWLKIVAENYCHQLYAKRIELDMNFDVNHDRNMLDEDSLAESTRNTDVEDVYKILNMMPNQRYRKLIEYRYINGRSNEETALLLGLSMANYYNSHKRAKDQFCSILERERLL